LVNGPLLRPAEVAALLQVSRTWVYDAAADGRLPSVRLGHPDGPLRFVREDVEAWLVEARSTWTPGRRH
jgi:excisionase family DNA binding protein